MRAMLPEEARRAGLPRAGWPPPWRSPQRSPSALPPKPVPRLPHQPQKEQRLARRRRLVRPKLPPAAHAAERGILEARFPSVVLARRLPVLPIARIPSAACVTARWYFARRRNAGAPLARSVAGHPTLWPTRAAVPLPGSGRTSKQRAAQPASARSLHASALLPEVDVRAMACWYSARLDGACAPPAQNGVGHPTLSPTKVGHPQVREPLDSGCLRSPAARSLSSRNPTPESEQTSAPACVHGQCGLYMDRSVRAAGPSSGAAFVDGVSAKPMESSLEIRSSSTGASRWAFSRKTSLHKVANK
jgi:hypothetical protein